jgi:glycosyltransferase involved in cell wall biosynthesis
MTEKNDMDFLKRNMCQDSSPQALSESVDISVVIPIYNEEENLPILIDQVRSAMNQLGKTWELILVDDGSSDNSAMVAERSCSEDNRIKFVQFRKNFGQTAATAAGFDHASGHVVVPMDGDLQNDPHDIRLLLEKLDEGYDVVSGWRHNRQDALVHRKIPSLIANRLIAWVTGVKLHDLGCSLKAYKKEILEDVKLYGEMHRFIPIIASSYGARIAEVPVRHHPRKFGKTKYGLMRTVKVLLDLLTVKFLGSYATKPLYPLGSIGFGAMLVSVALAVVVLFQKYGMDIKVHRNPLMLVAVMFFIVSIQFIAMGLLAELLTRTYHESQRKPIYSVKKRLNLVGIKNSHNAYGNTRS